MLLLLLARPLVAVAAPSPSPPGHVTIEQEIKLGNEVAAKVRKEFGGTWNNPEQLARVKRIAFKLFAVSDRHENERLRENFTVELLNTKVVNAMCVPGGHTFVTRGLLELGVNDDELACVMGHEITHAARRHGARNLEANKKLQSEVNVLTRHETLRKLMQIPILLYLFKHFDPQLEFEADYYGEIYASRAGYDPEGMVTLFERFDKMEGGHNASRFKRFIISLFDNHPPTPERISKAREEARKLKAGETLPTTEVPIYE
jgi:predicted Zn-dependent protease